jgi:glycosyltransferase involved in cell wall biosynthesis
LLYVGRVEHDKGVGDLIRAFALVSERHSLLTLRVVGDGSALNEFKTLARDLGCAERIEFTGRVNADVVAAAYATADLCICPTRWSFNEGLATVPLEAASFGVPTLMSLAVPAREYFGDAIVFEPENIEELVSKIRCAVTDGAVYKAACEDADVSFEAAMSSVDDWQAGVSSCLQDIENGTGGRGR